MNICRNLLICMFNMRRSGIFVATGKSCLGKANSFSDIWRGLHKRALIVFLGIIASPSVLATFADRIDALQPNQWGFMSTNNFSDAWPDPIQYKPTGNDGFGGLDGSPNAVIRAWSSFSWDSRRDQIIMYGGGHANYSGNEVYLWDADTGAWGRGSLPSEIKHTQGSNFIVIDGADNAPIAAHTYDNTLYLPISDRYVTFGGAVYDGGGKYKDADGNVTGPYFWDPSKADPNKVGGTTGSHIRPDLFPDVEGGQMWENRDHGLAYWNGLINGVTAYAEEDGKDVIYVGTSADLYKYTVEDLNDPTQDHWDSVVHSIQLGGVWTQGAGAYDPGSELFVRTAGPQRFILYDTGVFNSGNGRAGAVTIEYDVVGGDLTSDLAWAGMDYDSLRDRFVVWGYDGKLWSLTGPDDGSATGWLLTFIDALPSDIGFPDPSSVFGTGILGKWKYLSDYDVFLGLYSEDGGVWAYKPDDPNGNTGTSGVSVPATAWLLLLVVPLLRRRLR